MDVFNRLSSHIRGPIALLLVLCLTFSSIPAAFAEGEENTEPVVEEAAVAETVDETVNAEEPVLPAAEEPVTAVEEEVISEEESVPADEVEETAEEPVPEDVPCYIAVMKDTDIFADSEGKECAGKVLKGTFLYKTHTDEAVYSVLYAKNGEVLVGYIAADTCEIADAEAVAAYLAAANEAEDAVKHTTDDEMQIVLRNALAEEEATVEVIAAEETVPEETVAEETPAESVNREEQQEAPAEADASEAETAEKTAEETAEEFESAEAYAAIVEKAWDSIPTGVTISQTDVKKVTISWTSKNAPSYVVYELTGTKEVRRGYTNTTSITIPCSTFGYHIYSVYPYSAPNGRGSAGLPALTGIETYNQTWRKAPRVSVTQLTNDEGWFAVTWDRDMTASGYLVEISDLDGTSVFAYDSNGDKAKSQDTSKAIEAEETDFNTSDAAYTADESVVDKAANSITKYFHYEDEIYNSRQVKVKVTCRGTIDGNGKLGEGKSSSYKSLKLVPQWNKAPKITSCKQISEVEPKLEIQWDFYGSPDGFEIYDGRYWVRDVDAPTDRNYASLTLSYDNVGSHSYKIVPFRYGYPRGRASGAKSIRLAVKWMTQKVNVVADMITNAKARLSWNGISGIDGYHIYEVINYGRTVGYSYLGTTASTYYYVTPPAGIHNYVIQPYYGDRYGTLSAPKKVTITQSASSDKPVYRAYVVGNDYASNPNASTLNGCITDARTMTNLLQSMSGTKYSVTTCYKRSASQILSDISTAFAGAKEGDVSLFYYSGHGETGTGSLCGDNDNSRVTFAQLRAALDKVPGDKIVLLDSCYSGAAVNKDDSAVMQSDLDLESYAEAAIEAFANAVPKSGELATGRYYVITACTKYQTSTGMENKYDKNRSYGVFTRYFEKACGWDEINNKQISVSCDTNRDGYISLSEAYYTTATSVEAAGFSQVTRVNPENSSFVLFKR